jgi:hypothetical protein
LPFCHPTKNVLNERTGANLSEGMGAFHQLVDVIASGQNVVVPNFLQKLDLLWEINFNEYRQLLSVEKDYRQALRL